MRMGIVEKRGKLLREIEVLRRGFQQSCFSWISLFNLYVAMEVLLCSGFHFTVNQR